LGKIKLYSTRGNENHFNERDSIFTLAKGSGKLEKVMSRAVIYFHKRIFPF
jgi:hypothetical protein